MTTPQEPTELERLREALQKIATGDVNGDPVHGFSMYMNARKLALAALQSPATQAAMSPSQSIRMGPLKPARQLTRKDFEMDPSQSDNGEG